MKKLVVSISQLSEGRMPPNPQTGEYALNGEYTFKDVKFNNGFKPSDFVLKGI